MNSKYSGSMGFQRLIKAVNSGSGGGGGDGGLSGIFEIECGDADNTTVDFYYTENTDNIYMFRGVFVPSSTVVFTPYILPANFTEITFVVYCYSGAYGNIGTYSKTMNSGTNGITGDSGPPSTSEITFNILRNSQQYLRLSVDPT